jgi:hypothetical protein
MKGFWNTLIRLLVFAAFTLASFGLPHTALAQAECGEQVIVAQGDSLSKIARRCGTTVNYLLEMNPDITNPSRIRVGQRIALVEPEPVGPELNVLPARVDVRRRRRSESHRIFAQGWGPILYRRKTKR